MGVQNLLKRAASTVTQPAAGRGRLFLDPNGVPSVRDGDTGAVTSFGGALPATATPTTDTLGQSGAVGTSAKFAREDHAHPVTALTDTTHGSRAGGALHAQATGSVDGFLSAADKTKLDGTPTSVPPSSRTLTAGAGLTGGGDLSANRTFDVVNSDGSLTVSADEVRVGVLQTDAQHGTRGGGTLHAVASASTAGFQSAADKLRQDNMFLYMVNVADFGADLTGTNASDTALDQAIGTGGKIVIVPGGTLRLTGAPYVASANNVTLMGAGGNATTIKTNATTGDQLRFTGYGSSVRNLSIQGPGTGTTSNKTSGVGLDMQSVEGLVEGVNFSYQSTALGVNGPLVDAHDLVIRYVNVTAIVVNHNSDHRITKVTVDNAVATLPTGAGIDVQNTASLILNELNIIHSNWALNVSPAAGVTVPSIKATNCFFDTSVIGIRFAGAGAVFRSEFTNVWCGSMTQAGILVGPTTTGNQLDGVSFSNCSVYNNVAGTTQGVTFTTGNYGSVDFTGVRVAGWTTGVNIGAGSSTAFPTFKDCHVGAQSAFGVNTTGVVIAAGTYAGLIFDGCKALPTGNTTVITLGSVSPTNNSAYRITDNAGINPRGTVTAPATAPASGTLYQNNTGFRVTVYYKAAATAPTAVVVNGVSTVLPAALGVVPIPLDPGGTVQITGTVGTWTWVAN